MANNLVWSLLALIFAVLAAAFPLAKGDQPPPPRNLRSGSLVAALIVAAFAACTVAWPSTFGSGGPWAGLALAVGALMGLAANAVGEGRRGFVLGLAVFVSSLLSFVPTPAVDTASLALICGVFIGSFATGELTVYAGGSLCAVVTLGVVSVDFLARAGTQSSGAAPGTVLGVAALAATLISAALLRAGRFTAQGMSLVALTIIGFVACWKYFSNIDLASLWAGGVVIGAVVNALLAGEEKPDAFRFVLATVIWLAAATIAFGMALGYGMAVTIFAAMCTLVILGSTRGVMSLTVAAVVLLYRLFREMYPEDSRAPDIGQHYTMIGVAAGALIPLLPLEWLRGRNLPAPRYSASILIWLVILIGMPVAAAVLLGSKGAIGLIVGFGFAAVIEGIRGSTTLTATATATGLAAFVATSYGWLGEWADLERATKIRAVIYISIAVLVLAAALAGVGRPRSNEK